MVPCVGFDFRVVGPVLNYNAVGQRCGCFQEYRTRLSDRLPLFCRGARLYLDSSDIRRIFYQRVA